MEHFTPLGSVAQSQNAVYPMIDQCNGTPAVLNFRIYDDIVFVSTVNDFKKV